MRCKLDSTENLCSFQKYPTPPYNSRASPINLGWHFRMLFQSSRLKARTSLFTETWQKGPSSFELLAFENATPSGIGCFKVSKISALEASWRRGLDPYAPLLFNLYHYLEQNQHFGLVPENQFSVKLKIVGTSGQVQHCFIPRSFFVRCTLDRVIHNTPYAR
jgi:hypothetical protein